MDLLSDSVFPVTSVCSWNCSTAAQRSWQKLAFLVFASQFGSLNMALDYSVEVQQSQRAALSCEGIF